MGYRGYGLMYVCTSSACFLFLYYLLQPVFCYYFFFTVWIFLGRRRIYHVSAVDLRSSVERIIIPSALSNRSVRSLDFTIIYAIAFFFFLISPLLVGFFWIWFDLIKKVLLSVCLRYAALFIYFPSLPFFLALPFFDSFCPKKKCSQAFQSLTTFSCRTGFHNNGVNAYLLLKNWMISNTIVFNWDCVCRV